MRQRLLRIGEVVGRLDDVQIVREVVQHQGDDRLGVDVEGARAARIVGHLELDGNDPLLCEPLKVSSELINIRRWREYVTGSFGRINVEAQCHRARERTSPLAFATWTPYAPGVFVRPRSEVSRDRYRKRARADEAQ
jgi:hypothetical protein